MSRRSHRGRRPGPPPTSRHAAPGDGVGRRSAGGGTVSAGGGTISGAQPISGAPPASDVPSIPGAQPISGAPSPSGPPGSSTAPIDVLAEASTPLAATGPTPPPVGDGARRPGFVDDGEREHLRGSQAAVADAQAHAPGFAAGRPGSEGPTPRHDSREPGPASEPSRASCTVAQLRRFIKSRPWVPMHELRRRFGINGTEDDVTPIMVGARRLYIGLPGPEGRLVAELLSGGDVGYELSLDPSVPIVVGVYPMRPVPRT
jgi:hypothetical protein